MLRMDKSFTRAEKNERINGLIKDVSNIVNINRFKLCVLYCYDQVSRYALHYFFVVFLFENLYFENLFRFSDHFFFSILSLYVLACQQVSDQCVY